MAKAKVVARQRITEILDPPSVGYSTPYSREDFKARVERAYHPYVTMHVFPEQDRLDVVDLRAGHDPEPHSYTLAEATRVFPLPEGPKTNGAVVSTPGETSWDAYRSAREQYVKAQSRRSPQVDAVESRLRLWDEHGFLEPLTQAIRAVEPDLAHAEEMKDAAGNPLIDWRFLQGTREQLEYSREQVHRYQEAKRRLPQLRNGVVFPEDVIRPILHYLHVDVRSSRSLGVCPIPHEILERIHGRLLTLMAEAATKAPQAFAVVAPPLAARPDPKDRDEVPSGDMKNPHDFNPFNYESRHAE